jgi:hypothetical protein
LDSVTPTLPINPNPWEWDPSLIINPIVGKRFLSGLSGGIWNFPTSFQEWVVPAGEFITKIEARYGASVDAFTFITDTGTKHNKTACNV